MVGWLSFEEVFRQSSNEHQASFNNFTHVDILWHQIECYNPWKHNFLWPAFPVTHNWDVWAQLWCVSWFRTSFQGKVCVRANWLGLIPKKTFGLAGLKNCLKPQQAWYVSNKITYKILPISRNTRGANLTTLPTRHNRVRREAARFLEELPNVGITSLLCYTTLDM